MRKVILFGQLSLDGFYAGPDGDISWNMIDEELHAHFLDVLRDKGAFLNGRVTYEMMAAYWPTADEDPASTAFAKEFAPLWRTIPKFVFSKTLTTAGWNATIVRDVVREEIEEIRRRAGGDLIVGVGTAAAAFIDQDLIDEYRIYIHPVRIGAGSRLFPASREQVMLHLDETRTFGNGVVLLRYERLQRPSGGGPPR